MVSIKGLALLIGSICILVLAFQNCGQVGFQGGLMEASESLGSQSQISFSVTAPDLTKVPDPNTAPSTDAIQFYQNGQFSSGPFQIGSIGVQITGFSESDTLICIDSQFGNNFLCNNSRYFYQLPNELNAYKGFTYSRSGWFAEITPYIRQDVLRVSVKDSQGRLVRKSVQIQGVPGQNTFLARYFLNNQLYSGPTYKPNLTAELRVYGMQEADTYYCRQVFSVGAGDLTYDIESCPDSAFVKFTGNANWVYRDGIWVGNFSTNDFTLNNHYLYRFKDAAQLNYGSVSIVVSTDANGFVVGP
jgi:hypothetical protein